MPGRICLFSFKFLVYKFLNLVQVVVCEFLEWFEMLTSLQVVFSLYEISVFALVLRMRLYIEEFCVYFM